MALALANVLTLLNGDKSACVCGLNKPCGGEVYLFKAAGGINTILIFYIYECPIHVVYRMRYVVRA